VTDGSVRDIDNTWKTPDIEYGGVPFKAEFVSLIGLKKKSVGSLIDDWGHGWPLLGEMGAHPERWLELKGKGFRRLA